MTGTRVAVVLQPGTDATVLDAPLAEEGARLDRWLPGPRLAVASTTSPAAAARLAQVLRTHAAVVGAEPETYRPRLARRGQGDARAAEQWYAEKACLPAALEVSAGRPEVVLAIIDDGFDLEHEDLPEAHPDAADFADGDDLPAAGPLDDHGTAVAGIALARAGNGRGIIGFCPECSFLPIRRGATDLDDALAIAHAVDHDAAVINCSWGHSGASLAVTAAIAHAAEHGRDGKGAIVVFAAGNGGDDIEAIGDVSATAGVLAVMATGPDDRLRLDSNVGRDALAAPSGGQLTTDRTLGGYAVGPYTNDFGGTSGGAPVVSGTAALFIGVAPHASASEVRAALLETADRVTDDLRFEGGALRRLHAGRALARADGREESAFAPERCAMRALGEPERLPLEADCAIRAPAGSGTSGGWWSIGAALALSGLARRRAAARRATRHARRTHRAR